jgi:poly(A) polymerase Pap1
MTLGSYRLGIVSPSTDIDILCLSVMSQQEFFMTIQEFTPNAKDIKVLRVSPHTNFEIAAEITDLFLQRIEDAVVPILKLDVIGIKVRTVNIIINAK